MAKYPFLLCLLVFLFWNLACAQETAVKIGAIASLSGGAGEQGRNWLNGAQLALDELKNQGRKVELLVEDDETSPAKAASAFHKLAGVNHVQAIIGGTWDHLAEAVYPLAQQYRIPFVTPSNPIEILSPPARKNPWIFTTGLSIAASEKAVQEFISRKKPSSLAIIFSSFPFSLAHADMVERTARSSGTRNVFREEFSYEGYVNTMKVMALRVSRLKPEMVFIVADYFALDTFLRELQSLKSDPVILDTQHLDAAFELAGDAERYRNAYGIYPLIRDAGFAGAFQKKFGRAPRVYAAEGYDILKFLFEILSRRIDPAGRQRQFVFRGIAGEYRLPALTREICSTEAIIMHMRDGRLEPWK